jgi:hypothetical protein
MLLTKKQDAVWTLAQGRGEAPEAHGRAESQLSNFDLTSPPARYELPNAHGFFPPRDMKHYHGVEKIMQARCLFHVKSDGLLVVRYFSCTSIEPFYYRKYIH